MTIENLQAHYGFTRMPFGRALAPQMLHRHTTHAEAVARIGWCLTERGPRCHHRRGRCRQDRRRPGRPGRPGRQPHHHHLPGQPGRRSARSLRRDRHRPRRHPALPQGQPDPADQRTTRRRGTRTRPQRRTRARRRPPARRRPARGAAAAHLMPSPRLCRGDHGGERIALAGEGRPSRPLGITAARGSRLASPGAWGSREGGGS